MNKMRSGTTFSLLGNYDEGRSINTDHFDYVAAIRGVIRLLNSRDNPPPDLIKEATSRLEHIHNDLIYDVLIEAEFQVGPQVLNELVNSEKQENTEAPQPV